jgi:hypothetical protein
MQLTRPLQPQGDPGSPRDAPRDLQMEPQRPPGTSTWSPSSDYNSSDYHRDDTTAAMVTTAMISTAMITTAMITTAMLTTAMINSHDYHSNGSSSMAPPREWHNQID